MKDRPTPAGPQNPSEKPQVTPGMAALIRGGNGDAKSPEPKSKADTENLAAANQKKRLIQPSLVVADLLLISLITRLAFASHGHFGFFETTLCILALVIGAWLTCLALWLK